MNNIKSILKNLKSLDWDELMKDYGNEDFVNNDDFNDENESNEMITWDEMIKQDNMECIEFIGDGILPEHSTLMLAGPPKTGMKSLLVLQMAHALANYNDWFGHKVYDFHNVLIYQAEINESPLQKRLQLLTQGKPENNNKNDHIHFVSKPSLNILDPLHFQQICNDIERIEADIVIFDPLIRFHQVDENDNMKMDMVMNQFRRLNNKYNCSTIIVHHSRKDFQYGNIFRGASSILAAVDTMITVNPIRDRNMIKLDFVLRHGEAIESKTLVLNPTTLWLEEVNKAKDDMDEFIFDELIKSGDTGILRKDLEQTVANKFSISPRSISNKISGLLKRGAIQNDGKKRKMRLFKAKQGFSIRKN